MVNHHLRFRTPCTFPRTPVRVVPSSLGAISRLPLIKVPSFSHPLVPDGKTGDQGLDSQGLDSHGGLFAPVSPSHYLDFGISL